MCSSDLFHQEKTPSFSVSQAKQFYYCFGCGAKGDVFRYVMETERVDFVESVRRVAARSGIPVPQVSWVGSLIRYACDRIGMQSPPPTISQLAVPMITPIQRLRRAIVLLR